MTQVLILVDSGVSITEHSEECTHKGSKYSNAKCK